MTSQLNTWSRPSTHRYHRDLQILVMLSTVYLGSLGNGAEDDLREPASDTVAKDAHRDDRDREFSSVSVSTPEAVR
jgi:hypothetical protein